MKKLIALISVSLSFGFALALANTEDSSMNRDSASDTQQSGSAGAGISDSNQQSAGQNMQGDTHSTSEARMSDSKMGKSCTDEKGIMYKAGQKGFKECAQERSKHSEQMGGTAEGETETTTKTRDTYKSNPSPNPTER